MKPLRLAVLGDPIAHSLSPMLHRVGLARLHRKGSLKAIRVTAAELPSRLPELVREGYTGFSITLPHKVAIIPLLSELTHTARTIGAVNTVVVRDGRLIGGNTDGPGLVRLIADTWWSNPIGARAIVLGTGGAARAALFALARVGVAEVYLLGRSAAKAARLAAELERPPEPPWLHPGALSRSSLAAAFGAGARLVINATPLGLLPRDASPVPRDLWPRSCGGAIDLAYTYAHSDFERDACRAGFRINDGLPLLVYQGLLALASFANLPPRDEFAPGGLIPEHFLPVLIRLRKALGG